MAKFNFFYPSSSASANPSVGGNGVTAPTSSTEIGGINPSGNLTGVRVDASGNLIVSPLATTSTVTVVQPTGSLLHATIDSSALPTGASTSSLQTSGNASLTSIDGKTPALGQALAAASVPVVLTASQLTTLTPLTSVTVTQATGTNLHTVVDSGSITVTSSGLPTGASTSALQTSGNASLASIDTKTPALGQALAAASVPIVLTAAQLTTLTPLTSVTVTQATGSNLHVVSDAGTAIIGKVGIDQTTPGTTNGVQINAALPAGTNNIGKTSAIATTPTAGTVTQAAITIGTTAVRLTVSGSAPSATRSVLVFTPDSASTAKFYIGTSTVTNSGATRGIQISAGQTFTANSDAGDYYVIASVAAQTGYVMEQA